MRESSIERRLGREVKNLSCLYMKWVSPGNAGVPDRLIITPSGVWYAVELKTDSGRLSPSQAVQIKKLRSHHVKVRVIYGVKDIDRLVREIEQREEGRHGV